MRQLAALFKLPLPHIWRKKKVEQVLLGSAHYGPSFQLGPNLICLVELLLGSGLGSKKTL